MHKIIVITGPTAVGKTKLSIELAKKYDGEIINADAVQVYKGLDIGSAKVTEEEKEGIPHHLLDFKEVTEEYTIYHYQKDCREKIKDIQSRNKTPILVGGTGLYIKAALYDYKLSEEKSTNTYDNLTNEELYEELKKLDKDIIIDKDNRRRLIRAINYYKENNESINKNKTNKLLYNVIFIGLTTDRQVLYDKINKRVDEMISQGLFEEVKSFYDKGIKSKPLLNAIGYRELYNYLDGMGYPISTSSMFITESLHDIKALIKALGGNKKTILSFAGFGDLLLTCTSVKSRNYTLGKIIGEGKSKEEINKYIESTTIEGLYTLKSIKKLLRNKKIKMPIIDLIYDIIINDKEPSELKRFLIEKE